MTLAKYPDWRSESLSHSYSLPTPIQDTTLNLAHSLIKELQVRYFPRSALLCYNLIAWPIWIWSAQPATAMLADAKLHNYASVYISLQSGILHPVNMNPKEMTTKEFHSKETHGFVLLIHLNSRCLLQETYILEIYLLVING